MVALVFWWVAVLILGGGRPVWVWAALSPVVWIFAAKAFSLQGAKPNRWLFLWLVWTIISFPFGAEPLNALQKLGVLLSCFAFYFAVERGFVAREKEFFLRAAICCGYGLALLFIACSALGINVSGHILPPNKNYAACLIAASAAGALAMLTDGNYPGKKKTVLAVFTAAALAAVFLIKSRSALAAIFIAALLTLVLRRKFKTAAAVFALAVLAFALAPETVSGGILKAGEKYPFERIGIWLASLKISAQHPFFGMGLGCYERGFLLNNFPAFSGVSYYGHYAAGAHSEPLEIAAETGIMGAVLFLAFFLTHFRARPDDSLKIKALAVAGAVFGCSLFEGVMRLPAVSLLFFGALACAWDGETEPARNAKIALVIGLLITVLGSAVRIRSAKIAGNAASLIKIYPADSALYAGMARAGLAGTPPNPFISLAFLDEAIARSPANAHYRLWKAEILSKLGQDGEPDARAAILLEPNYKAALVELALSALRKGNCSAANGFLRRLDKLGGLKPESGYDEILLSQDGRAAQARKAAEKCRPL